MKYLNFILECKNYGIVFFSHKIIHRIYMTSNQFSCVKNEPRNLNII